MTRILEDFKPWDPKTPETASEADPARETPGSEPVTGPDFLRLLRMEAAASQGSGPDPKVLARTVVDWWIRHHLATRAWPEPLLQEFREQVVQVLQGDPLLQALIRKLTS